MINLLLKWVICGATACLLLTQAVLADTARLPSKEENEKVSISAYRVHEVCMKMSKGESLIYSFNSTAPLDFNLHYHLGSEVVYPVLERGKTAMQGEFEAGDDQQYCLMWRNRNNNATSLELVYKKHLAE